jgi:hypothetical protein
MGNISNVRAKIKAKLDALVTAGTIGAVLNGEQNPQFVEISAYPCVEIVRMGTEPEYFTNREDIQSYVFHLRVYQQMPGDDWDTVEIGLDDTIDAIIQAFLDDASLTGTINARIEPMQNTPSVISWNGKMHRREVIVLKCRVITAMAGS